MFRLVSIVPKDWVNAQRLETAAWVYGPDNGMPDQSIANGKRATGRDGRASQSSAPIFQIGALSWLAVVPLRAAAYLGAKASARNSLP